MLNEDFFLLVKIEEKVPFSIDCCWTVLIPITNTFEY